MSDCVFCSIIDGKTPAKKVYEDNRALAFLDKHPSAPGHTLIIPKAHVRNVEDLSQEDAEAVFMALHKIIGPIQKAMDAPASTIGINNGPEAGQEIPHLHLHIIPRRSKSEGGIIQSIVRKGRGSNSLEENSEKIKKEISKI